MISFVKLDAQKITIANFGHPVSKSWLRLCMYSDAHNSENQLGKFDKILNAKAHNWERLDREILFRTIQTNLLQLLSKNI